MLLSKRKGNLPFASPFAMAAAQAIT